MNFNGKLIPAVVVGLLVAVIGYYVLSAPDNRNPVQKVGDAISELPNGPEKAARELESRTPGDKLKDAVEDEKADIKKTLNQ
jgi:cell division protein FtsN